MHLIQGWKGGGNEGWQVVWERVGRCGEGGRDRGGKGLAGGVGEGVRDGVARREKR